VTALFSATMPKPIVDLAQQYLRQPEMLRLSSPRGLTVPEVDQVFYLVPFVRKMDALCRVLDAKQPERAIVFCATKRMVDEAVEGLGARGYLAEALHGDISQAIRERVLRAFRSGKTEVLVATDVAARGLDVPEVSHVINFDIPPDPEYYVHRIGRTARYGRRGEAITFVNPREMRVLHLIERVTGVHIRREEIPTAAEVEEREAEILEERLLASLAKGNWGRYRPMIEELLEDHDPIDVAAAALSLVASGPGVVRRGTGASVPVAARAVLHDRPRHTPPAPASSDEQRPERSVPVASPGNAPGASRRAPDTKPSRRVAADAEDGRPKGTAARKPRRPTVSAGKRGAPSGARPPRPGPKRRRER
jgi:superfamily II DNA/RNA helicase